VRVGLRIAVSSVRGAREIAPRFADLLHRFDASGSFFVNLGPHRLAAVLPGRSVAHAAGAALRSLRDAGFEIGVAGWDTKVWRRRVPGDDYAWTEAALNRAVRAHEDLLGTPPRAHAAPDWRMNRHAFRLLQRFGFEYGSDTRGTTPFVPVCAGELVLCAQIPSTLPTLSELAREGGRNDVLYERVVAAAASGGENAENAVFPIEAERDLLQHQVTLERALDAWRAQGIQVVALHAMFETLDLPNLARCTVALASASAAGGHARQDAPFLAALAPAHAVE
jgi:peptidoglycan/xylan/chitin deacetylase (PgdA/CDA1 family)